MGDVEGTRATAAETGECNATGHLHGCGVCDGADIRRCGGRAQTPSAPATVVASNAQPIQIGSLALTVQHADLDSTYNSIYNETPPAAHGVYILLTVKATNVGSSPVDSSALIYGEHPYDDILLRDQQGRTFSLDSISMSYIEPFQQVPEKFQPGLSYKVYLSFDVPINALSGLTVMINQTPLLLDPPVWANPPATATAAS